MSERINAAYASTEPVVLDPGTGKPAERGSSERGSSPSKPDDTTAGEQTRAGSAEGRRPSGAERFAAVLASTTGAKGGKGAAGASAAAGEASPTRPRKAPAAGAAKGAGVKRVRRARLRLTHIDPWSVMKTSFLLSVAIGIVTVVAVAVVWSVIGAAGVWDSINSAIGDVLGDSSEGFNIEDYVGMSRVMGFTMVVAVVDVVLITVIATLAAFLYNLAAALLGGIEVVLAEDDR